MLVYRDVQAIQVLDVVDQLLLCAFHTKVYILLQAAGAGPIHAL